MSFRNPITTFALRILSVTLCFTLLSVSPVSAQTDDSLRDQYRQVTKDVLVTGIDLEQYVLRYRLEGARQSGTKLLRYGLLQEAGAAGGLAFEIITADQLKEGRKNPFKIDKDALKAGFRTAFVTSIIAGSGSVFELGSNAWSDFRNHRNGISSHKANIYVSSKLKTLDELLAKRDALVAAHKDHPLFRQAELEGRVLHHLRDASAYEYAMFHRDIRGFKAAENSFFLLNAAANTLAAISAKYGMQSLKNPDLNGTANILFLLSGAFTTATPIVSTGLGKLVGKLSYNRVSKLVGEPKFDYEGLKAASKEFSDSLKTVEQDKVSFAVFRAGNYVEETELFRKQLDRETALIRTLGKVAVQNSVIGPAIGSTLLTQGILGTVGFYRYHPRLKELDLQYKGAVTGMVGTSMAVGVNAAAILAGTYYEQKLKRQKRLPRQLIEQRLQRLDELKGVIANM